MANIILCSPTHTPFERCCMLFPLTSTRRMRKCKYKLILIILNGKIFSRNWVCTACERQRWMNGQIDGCFETPVSWVCFCMCASQCIWMTFIARFGTRYPVIQYIYLDINKSFWLSVNGYGIFKRIKATKSVSIIVTIIFRNQEANLIYRHRWDCGVCMFWGAKCRCCTATIHSVLICAPLRFPITEFTFPLKFNIQIQYSPIWYKPCIEQGHWRWRVAMNEI